MSRAVNSSQNTSAFDRDNKGVEALLQLGDTQNPDANDQHIVKLVDWVLQFAFEQGASDIHLEPRKDKGRYVSVSMGCCIRFIICLQIR